MSIPHSPPTGGAVDARPVSFADALAVVAADPSTRPERMRQYRSAVASLGRVTGRTAENLPLAPSALRPLLVAVLPARHRMSRKRWANIRSVLANMGALTGHVTRRAEHHVPLEGAWAEAMALLPKTPQSAALTGFARFCQMQKISPTQGEEAALKAYRAFLLERTYELDPGATINSVRRMWNAAVDTVEGWPGRKLTPPHNPHVWALKFTAFPASLAAELDTYIGHLAAPDPFEKPLPPIGNYPGRAVRPLSPTTIADRRRGLVRAASVLVEAGQPIETITGLAALVTPVAMRTVLTDLCRQGGGRAWKGEALQMATNLFDVARRHLRLPEAELLPLLEIRTKVAHRYAGLTERARGRLAQFDDRRLLRKLFELPAELFKAADRLLKEGCPARAAAARERGLALAILLLLPMRRRNLAALDIERHFVRDQNGRVMTLCIPGTEVKNGIAIEAAVPPDLARRIARHLTVYRPLLPGMQTSTTRLFPGVGEKHRCPEAVGRNVSQAVRDAVGAEFNPHLLGHLAATLLYDADPNSGPIAQRLLGHSQLKITEGMYGVLSTRSGQRVWADLLDRKRDALWRNETSHGGRR
ncbi:site-specific integrase [Roseicella aerolata]|uniref:Tyr recombinase domain-containing protein n=1 Tax=Roseicella aerolata TaxID=2883479 RepID=A0A9X1ILW5_9PROT|nr:hypothetical protein [Roseicella aerolata]MCB4825530.1 hypothetical protein [Roseicella aerolata]